MLTGLIDNRETSIKPECIFLFYSINNSKLNK